MSPDVLSNGYRDAESEEVVLERMRWDGATNFGLLHFPSPFVSGLLQRLVMCFKRGDSRCSYGLVARHIVNVQVRPE